MSWLGIYHIQFQCRAPLNGECPEHQGHKRDPGVTPRTCGAVAKRAQVVPVWVSVPGIENASHLCRLGGTRVTPCCASFHEECLKHHGHKKDPGVTPETCGSVGEKAQVILVWLRASGVGNASHPQRLESTKVRP